MTTLGTQHAKATHYLELTIKNLTTASRAISEIQALNIPVPESMLDRLRALRVEATAGVNLVEARLGGVQVEEAAKH